MKEGWHNEEHFILFESQEEARTATERYGLPEHLAGVFIVGLRGWDNFILCDESGAYFSVPTVPLWKEEVRPYSFPSEKPKLKADARFENRIKWYIKPIAFGGDAAAKEYIAWISHDDHAQAVRYWNGLHRDLRKKA